MTSTTFDKSFDNAMVDQRQALQPMPFWGSLIAFGAPALLMIFSYHVFLPWMIAVMLTFSRPLFGGFTGLIY